MTTKAKVEPEAPVHAPAPAPAPAPARETKAKTPKARADGQCVVDDGTGHTGRAVNGLVCSRHANRYHADGTPR